MKKYWAVLLLAIAATQAYASDKEYTSRICSDEDVNKYLLGTCKICKEDIEEKISFKVNKSIKSVMHIFIAPDGTSSANVIDNCKIFDENNFQCTTNEQGYDIKKNKYTTNTVLTVTNGSWEQTSTIYKLGINDLVYIGCGLEIKN